MARVLMVCIIGAVVIAGGVALWGGSVSARGGSISTVLIVAFLALCCGGMLFGMRGKHHEGNDQRHGPHARIRSDRTQERR